MMRALLLLVIVAVTFAGGQHIKFTCDDDDRKEAEKKHQECVDQAADRTKVGGIPLPNGGHLVDICQRLEEQIHTCGKHLDRCLTAFDLRLMKDAQIDAFTKFMDAENRGHLYQECQIVKEYKNSGRRPYKATELCNLSEMERALEEREKCVDSETRLMQAKQLEVPRGLASRRAKIICDFVDKAMDDCSRPLQNCYKDEDYQKFKANSYQILAEALHKVEADFRLSECQELSTPVPLVDPSGGAQIKATLAVLAVNIVFAIILM